MNKKEDNNNFCRDHYRRALKWTMILSIVAVTLVSILVSLMLTTPKAKYYATTTTGQVVPMHALDEPVVTDGYLLQWASVTMQSAFNIGFVRYASEMENVEPNFTPSAWEQFQNAIKKSGVLDTVISKKLEVNAIVSGAPIVLATDVVHGRFTWHVQIPLLLTLTSASETTRLHWLATLNIQRVSTLDAYKGIQISGLAVEEGEAR